MNSQRESVVFTYEVRDDGVTCYGLVTLADHVVMDEIPLRTRYPDRGMELLKVVFANKLYNLFADYNERHMRADTP